MQPENFTKTLYVTADKLKKLLFKSRLRCVSPLADDLFEVTVSKDTINVRQCPQMGFFVYALSKLRMLSFGFEWMRMMERSLFCLVLTDTDSYYMALARKTWEECVREDISVQELHKFKTKYFALTFEQSKYRGLFHVEFDGTLIIALQPKLYFALSDDTLKISARGVDKKENKLDVELFRRLLLDPPKLDAAKLVQRTFRVVDNSMVSYRLLMSNINSFYIKRTVLPNLIDTAPLNWSWPPEFNL